MNSGQLIALIRERGLTAVADAVRKPWAPALEEGLNLTEWSVTQAPGALLFAHLTDGLIDGEPRLLCVNAPESERAGWERLVAECGSDTLVTLLLLPQHPDPFA